ncbi:hypothetical protein [Amycolatopsis thermoflava]|uniref:hypothetical protein n=1 Tax=Amycolatopsis thermoflava TaxID=84480 RepID=UPI003F49D714
MSTPGVGTRVAMVIEFSPTDRVNLSGSVDLVAPRREDGRTHRVRLDRAWAGKRYLWFAPDQLRVVPDHR